MSNFVDMGDKKKDKTMAEVTAGYDEFIKDRELNNKGAKLFNKVVKKAAKPKKQRGSK